ncbi:hypothetical protein CDL15_Pgr025978 [Punica granatum]|uniref:Uncharacterized protein n=1 Tax=Punica granatum TaxID=22663 RepID=A0A218WCD6_PUNGR|nr:hypothetical protein CDL15_Pgr025978 [Punica granatum]
MTKGGEMIKTADEKPAPKPEARLPPKRGAVKARIFKLLWEKLVSVCQCSSPTADLGEAGGGASISKSTSVVSPFPNK